MTAQVSKSVYHLQTKQYEVPVWLQLVYFLHRYIVRSCFRWFMQKFTGLTLLERVQKVGVIEERSKNLLPEEPKTSEIIFKLLKNTKCIACITTEVERLIDDYDLPQLYNGWTEENELKLVDVVLHIHCLERDEQVYEDLKRVLGRTLRQIREYKELCEKVERRRREKYDSTNSHHEKKLQKLWEALVPDEDLVARQTKQWQLIGFQGDDPATDFRGMGMLALDQLLFFARYDVDNARTVLHLSMNDNVGFPMAITGITITSALCQFLFSGDLKNHFYNTVTGSLKMDDFHHAYCQMFKMFSDVWNAASPSSIMAFNSIFSDFCEQFSRSLKHLSANLNTMDFN